MEDPMELSEENKEILRLKVKINGEFEEIAVGEHDEPLTLAKAFCLNHGLSAEKCLKLAITIERSIEELIEEEENSCEPPVESPKKNIGEELYEKGLQMKQKVFKQAAQERIQEYNKEAKELTFRPATTQYSSPKRRNFYSRRKPTVKRESYTFSPTINQKSAEIDKNKQVHTMPRYELLYSRAKPRVASPSQLHTRKSSANLQRIQEASERLYLDAQRTSEKKERIAQAKDERMSREYFSPKIGRGPMQPRTFSNIGEHLFSQQPQFASPSVPDFRPAASSHSTFLFNMKKKRVFSDLFSLLNPKGGGQLYYKAIPFNELPYSLIKMLSPFFEEFSTVSQGLTLGDFTEAMKNLTKILSPTERNELLNYKVQIQPGQEQIQERRPQKIGTLHQRCIENRVKSEVEIHRERQKMVEDALVECTFRPSTVFYRPERSITKILHEKNLKFS